MKTNVAKLGLTWSYLDLKWELVEVKLKLLQNISHYYNNRFAFHMPMFTISILSLNKFNIIIHSNIRFMVIAYN
jgi:hypothetical protein